MERDMSPVEVDVEDIITDLLTEVDSLNNAVSSINTGNIEDADRTFVKRVLPDLTAVIYDTNYGKYIFRFDKGVKMFFDGNSERSNAGNGFQRDGHNKLVKVIKRLLNLGFLELRTSAFQVELSDNSCTTVYFNSYKDLFTYRNLYSKLLVRNIHDDGYNCWGGWAASLRTNIDSGSLEMAIMTLNARSKQLNIEDIAGNSDKQVRLFKNNYQEREITIPTSVLVAAMVSEGFDSLFSDRDFLRSIRDANSDQGFNRLFEFNSIIEVDTREHYLKLYEIKTKITLSDFVDTYNRMTGGNLRREDFIYR